MPDTGWLKEVLEDVKQEVDRWPSWMREREYTLASNSQDDSSEDEAPETRLSEPNDDR